MKHAINWFEIPVKDFDLAKNFYDTVFDYEMPVLDEMGMKSAFFYADHKDGAIGGCITLAPNYIPSDKGTLIYLNGGDDLKEPLSRIEKAGGKIVLPKTAIGENGFIAHFIDTEGNKIGLHSRK